VGEMGGTTGRKRNNAGCQKLRRNHLCRSLEKVWWEKTVASFGSEKKMGKVRWRREGEVVRAFLQKRFGDGTKKKK